MCARSTFLVPYLKFSHWCLCYIQSCMFLTYMYIVIINGSIQYSFVVSCMQECGICVTLLYFTWIIISCYCALLYDVASCPSTTSRHGKVAFINQSYRQRCTQNRQRSRLLSVSKLRACMHTGSFVFMQQFTNFMHEDLFLLSKIIIDSWCNVDQG